MSDDKLFLKPTVRVEPLVDSWHARSQLIPPATAAMNLFARYARILQSYVLAPQIHQAATKNPRMAGGPFIDFEEPRVEEVRALLRLLEGRAPQRALFEGIEELDRLLRAEAKGYALQPLYDKVPAPLRGAVELVYDRDNQPSFRLIEPLLYRSALYDPSMQSLMLSEGQGHRGASFLSTPRLDGRGLLQLPLGFAHPGVNALFGMARKPQSFAAIKAQLEVEDRDAPLLRSLLTEDPPEAIPATGGRGVRWRHFGHGGVLLEAAGASLLIDPLFDIGSPVAKPHPGFEALPARIDDLLITHDEQDGLLLETLLRLRHRVGRIVVPRSGGGALQDPSLRLLLNAIGFDNVVELGELEELAATIGTIIGLPFLGGHGDLDVRSKLSYRIEAGGHSVVFAAGVGNPAPALYDRLRDGLGPVDLLFLSAIPDGAPLSWDYGALFTAPLPRDKDQSRRNPALDLEGAREIVARLAPGELAIHIWDRAPWSSFVTGDTRTKAEEIAAQLIAFARQGGAIAEQFSSKPMGRLN